MVAVVIVVTESVHVWVVHWVNYLAEITLPSDLLGLTVLVWVIGTFAAVAAILWKLVEATSWGTKYLVWLKVLTAVGNLALVWIIWVLLQLSLVCVVANLGVVVKASSHVVIVSVVTFNQFWGVTWVVVVCRCRSLVTTAWVINLVIFKLNILSELYVLSLFEAIVTSTLILINFLKSLMLTTCTVVTQS